MNSVSPNKVKKLRVEKGWTQEQLAQVTSLSYRTIQRIEKDGRCSLDSKMALSSAFGISFLELTSEGTSVLDLFFSLRFLHDGAGNYKSVNASDPDTLTLPADQIVGKNCAEILPPEVSNQILIAIEDLKNGVKSVEFDYLLTLSDGPHFFRAKIIKSGQDLFLSVVTEISEQKSLEKKLLKSLALLNMVADSLKSGAWEFDLATNNSYWTQQVFDIHELDKTPTIAECLLFYAPQARPIIQEAFNKLYSSGEPFDLVLPFISATGKDLWVRVIGWAEYHNSKITKLLGVIQDITHLKTPVLQPSF